MSPQAEPGAFAISGHDFTPSKTRETRMPVMQHPYEDYQAFRTKLGADAAHLVSEFDGLFHKLLGEAATDAADVAQQAETAAEPVVKTAEGDAEQLAQDAASGAAAVVDGAPKEA